MELTKEASTEDEASKPSASPVGAAKLPARTDRDDNDDGDDDDASALNVAAKQPARIDCDNDNAPMSGVASMPSTSEVQHDGDYTTATSGVASMPSRTENKHEFGYAAAMSGVASTPSTNEVEHDAEYAAALEVAMSIDEDAAYAAAIAASEEEAMQPTTNDDMDDDDDDNDATAQSIEIKSSPLETCVREMIEWFENSGPDETDEMIARQLDYIFKGDRFGSQWWKHLRTIGFKHVVRVRAYLLPESSAPLSLQNIYYSAEDIYGFLDTLHVPYLYSPIKEFEYAETQTLLHKWTEEEMHFWRDVRDYLIFQKFRVHIDSMNMNNNNGETKKRAAISSVPQRRTSTRRQKQRSAAILRRSSTRLAAVKTSNVASQDSSKTTKKAPPSKATQQQEQKQPGRNNRFPTVQEYVEYVQNTCDYDTVKQNEASYRGMYKKWQMTLHLNHSLLFYGVGSKRHFLSTFSKELDNDGKVLELDGFNKDITIEGILNLIVALFLKGKEPTLPEEHEIFYNPLFEEDDCGSLIYPSNNTVQRAMAIAIELSERVATSLQPLYIILHNIDGEALRNSTAQEALSILVYCSVMPEGRSMNAVKLVASIDHVDAPTLLWDSLTAQRFRWVWNQVNTHRPFIKEITESSLGLDDELQQEQKRKPSQRKGGQADDDDEDSDDDDDNDDDVEADILNVLKSLAPRPTESLQVLANLQLSCSTLTQYTGEPAWVEYTTLLKKCQLECLITGDHQLRLFLKEFADHEIIEWKATAIRIPYSTDTLLEIINFQQDDDE